MLERVGATPTEVWQYLAGGRLAPDGLLFLVQACVSAPLWEELFRGYAHRALAAVHIPFWFRVGGVALVFSGMHSGEILSLLPAFLILGYLVERGMSWGQRAAVHAMTNALVLLDGITIYLGGTRLTDPTSMMISLGIQAVFCLLIAIYLGKRLMRQLKEGEREKHETPNRTYVFSSTST